jgi:hypothetical protein
MVYAYSVRKTGVHPQIASEGMLFAEHALLAGYFNLNDRAIARTAGLSLSDHI